MTKIELIDLCKQYQIPSSNINKTKLIERIKQTQNKINNQGNFTFYYSKRYSNRKSNMSPLIEY
jgi:hypothetical protein